MFQIKNPDHSHIKKGEAVATLTATFMTNASSQPGETNDDGQPQLENAIDAELDRAINAKLGGGYKNVFNPTDHLPVMPENQSIGQIATSLNQGTAGSDNAAASLAEAGDSDQE